MNINNKQNNISFQAKLFAGENLHPTAKKAVEAAAPFFDKKAKNIAPDIAFYVTESMRITSGTDKNVHIATEYATSYELPPLEKGKIVSSMDRGFSFIPLNSKEWLDRTNMTPEKLADVLLKKFKKDLIEAQKGFESTVKKGLLRITKGQGISTVPLKLERPVRQQRPVLATASNAPESSSKVQPNLKLITSNLT